MFAQKFTVTKTEAGQRIDSLCAKKFTQISRSRWTKHGEFKCNNIAKTAKIKSKEGDEWEVSCTEEASGDHLEPWDQPLEILAESASWLVINKPYGVSVHPSSSESTNKTVVNALVHHYGKNLATNFDDIEGRQVPRPGLVHRLDKTTSGVLLVAKTNAAHKFFQDHWPEFQKIYTALVLGRPPETGKIESGIMRDPHQRQKMMATQDTTKWSITEFETLKTTPGTDSEESTSLLKVIIKTGRTHQIRVHLSSIGFPIIGDEMYDGPPAERVMLHASELKFLDPDTNKEAVVEADVSKIFNKN